MSTIEAWFSGRLPDDWFTGPPEVSVDRDEILVVGPIPEPELPKGKGTEADDARREARVARIQRFREDTRAARMDIADEAERRFGRKVAWGAKCGEARVVFTSLSIPVMTRLRMTDRQVLDTLVESRVARSRSEALAWCVRLVGQHQSEWIKQLKDALVEVERVRKEGPAA